MSKNNKNRTNCASDDSLQKELRKEFESSFANCDCKDENCNCNSSKDIKSKNIKTDNEENTCNCDDSNYLEIARRLKAEFENYKKRNAEVGRTSYLNGVFTSILKLLPVIDSFQQAKGNITDDAVLSGIDMIYNQLISAFNELGVAKIDCLGKVFDPNYHNAVLTAKDENYPDETILEEYQPGFTLGERVIRHSVVKINKLS